MQLRVFLPPEVVLARFVARTGTPLAELQGMAQTRDISRRRQEAMWLLRQLSTASLGQIGTLLGGRSGPTVDEGIDRVSMRALNEPVYRQLLSDLRDAIAEPGAEGVADGVADGLRLTMAIGLLADTALSDADARHAALVLLGGRRHG